MDSCSAGATTFRSAPTSNVQPSTSGPLSVTATVAPSGESLVVQFLDGLGQPTPVNAYAPAASQTLFAEAASGTFTLTFKGQTTSALAIGIPGAMPDGSSGTGTIQGALEALSTIGVGNVQVRGVFHYTVTWTGALATSAQPLITVNTGGLSTTASAPPTTAGTTQEVDQDASGANFTKTGVWTSLATGSGHAYSATTTGSGLTRATWSIPGLATGNYNVLALFPGSSAPAGYATTAPYRLMDGTTFRGKHLVNQSNPLATTAFPVLGGLAGQSVGTVYVTGGNTLTVTLSDDVASGDVGLPIYAGYLVVQPLNSMAMVIHDDAPGTTQTTRAGTWLRYTDPSLWNGAQSYSLPSSAGNTTTWHFSGLMPGSYTVQWNWAVDPGNRTTHAAIQVFDGSTSLGSFAIDQNVMQTGSLAETDSNSVSHPFTPIGGAGHTFTVTSGTALVTLTAQSDNTTNAGVMLVQLQTASGYAVPIASSSATLVSGPPTYSKNGGSPITLTNVLWGVTQDRDHWLPYIVFLLPSPVLSSDVLTFTLSSGVVACAAGAIPGVTNLLATNKVGGTLVALPPPGAKPLTVGMNVGPVDSTVMICSVHANQCKRITELGYTGSDSPPPAKTADGYPQFLHRDDWNFGLGAGLVNPVDSKGYPYYPTTGTTTIRWDGAFGEISAAAAVNTTGVLISSNTGHATGNERKFAFSLSGSSTYSPDFQVTINGLLVTADDADPGRASYTGTWTAQTSSGWNSTYHTNDKLTASTATWNLGPLPAGPWLLQAYWPHAAGNTTNATFKVYEGATLKATVTADQTAVPAGPGGPQDLNGVQVANTLTLYNSPFAGGTVTVTLTGGTDGFAVADAIIATAQGNLGSLATPVTNLRVFDPSVNLVSPVGPLDANGEPKFHPQAFQQFHGITCVRMLGLWGANTSPQYAYSQFAAGTEFSYSNLRRASFTITKVEHFTDPNHAFPINYATIGYTAILITLDNSVITSFPIVTGVAALVEITANFGGGPGFLPMVGVGGYARLAGDFGCAIYHDPSIMAANQFAMYTDVSAFPASDIITQTGANLGSILLSYVSIPIQDGIDFVNYIDAQNVAAGLPRCAMWVNTPQAATTACTGSMFAAIGNSSTGVNTGLKVVHEHSNEPWNTGFGQYAFFGIVGALAGGGAGQGYAISAAAAHDAAIAAWTGAGRSRGDYTAMFGDQFGQDAQILPVLAYCKANNKPFDAACVAPYMGNYPAGEAALATVYALMTVDQVIDCYESKLAFDNYFQNAIAASFATITDPTTGFPSAKLMAYEASLNVAALDWGAAFGGSDLVAEKQAWSGHFHPRMGSAMMPGYVYMCQQAGMTGYLNYYIHSQALGPLNSVADIDIYGPYVSWNMQAGQGDGTDGKYNQLPSLAGTGTGIGVVNLSQAVSPIGQGIKSWNGLSTGVISSKPPVVMKFLPRFNRSRSRSFQR